jgi:hypothetical protein
MIMAGHGWDAGLFLSQPHCVKLHNQFDNSLPKFQVGKNQANSDQRLSFCRRVRSSLGVSASLLYLEPTKTLQRHHHSGKDCQHGFF